MDTQGTIGIKATLDISEMQKNVQKYVQNIDMMQDHTDVASTSVAKSFNRMVAAGTAFLSLDLAKRLGAEMISVYGTFQQLDIAFKTMLHSGEKAKKLMGELVDFAAVTPFNLVDVGQGAKQLLAYGTKVESIKTELEMLGNVASGVSIPLGDLIYLYGTLRSQGRAYSVDIRQFAGRGIPIYAELAKVLQVDLDKVNGLVEAGKVGFPQVEQAFQNMTNEGGMFFSLMEEQSKSVTGKISNLKDKIDVMFNELGKENDSLINSGIDGVSYLVDHYESIGTTLTALITLVGIHKAAVVAQAAVYKSLEKANYIAATIAEADALKSLETEEIRELFAKKKLKAGSVEYAAALKEEIQAEKDKQVQIVQTANDELSVAKERLTIAEETKDRISQNVQIKKEELASVVTSAQAEKTASLEKKIGIESEKQSRAALQVLKLEEQKNSQIAMVQEMKYQQWLQASAGKETSVIDAKIAAKNREIAVISEKIAVAKAEEIQHSKNIVAMRGEIKAVDSSVTSKGVQKAQTELNTAEQNLNSAAVNVNTIANDVNSKEIILGSETKKLDTLETGLNTASENKNTVAKTFGARATNLLRVATAKFYAVLSANVWTIAAIGIAAVVYGIYKFCTAATEAEIAQERYNKKIEEANKLEQTRKEKLESLVSELQNEYTADVRRVEILNLIKREYPAFFKLMIDEKGHVMDLTEAWKAYNEEVAKNKATQHKQGADDMKKKIADQKRFLELFDMDLGDRQKSIAGSDSDKAIWQKYNSKGTYNIKKEIEKNELELIKWEKDVREDSFNQWQADLGKKTDKQIDAIRSALVRRAQAANGDKRLLSALGKRIITIDAENSKRKATPANYDEAFNTAKDNWEKAKKALEDIEKDKKAYSQKQYEDAKKLEEDTEKSFKGLGGETGAALNKKENSSKKAAEEANKLKVEQAEIQRQIEEQNQQAKDKAVQAELELTQATIDAKDEGFLKQQEQINLNYRKAKADNARRAAEYLKDAQQAERLAFEKKHPDYKDKGLIFVPTTKTKSDLSPDKKETLDGYDKAATDAREKAEATLAKSLMEQYQDYTDQRLAIEKKFNDDIAALRIQREKYEKEGDTERVKQTDRAIAQGTKEKGESLVNFDYDQLKKSPDYVRAFENLKQTSSETLSSLLEQLEGAKEAAARVLSPDQLREYTSTIQSIMDELDERNPFQVLADRKKELAEAEEELAKAKKELDAVNNGAQIVTGVKSTKYNKDTGKIESEKSYLSASSAMTKYNKAQDKVIKKSAQVDATEKKVTESFGKLFSAVEEVGSSVGGLTGEIISMIGSIGMTVTGAIQGLSTASKTAAGAIQTVEKASVILAIISAAVQLATKVASFFAADYSEYNQAKEAYESYAQVLDTVIEKQKELVKTLTGENAKNAYEYAIELIGKQTEATRILGKERLNAGASAGSHSIGVRIKDSMSSEGWQQAQKALGDGAYNQIKDGRMTGLFDLSVEQLSKLQSEAPIFWAKLDGDVKEYLESIIESGEKIEEMNEAWKESLTGVSFDSVYESFLDTLYDMDASAQDFAKSFADYMRQAMIKTMFDKKYKAQLEQWYDLFAEYMDNDGTIDEREQAELDRLKNGIVDGAKAGADLINEQFKDIYDEGDSREASSKGIATASQDSVEELNGRMTMTNVLINELKSAVADQTSIQTNISIGIIDLKAITLAVNANVSIIKDNTAVIIGHLANIETNTARLEGMQADMKLVRFGIEKINDKGVKLSR